MGHNMLKAVSQDIKAAIMAFEQEDYDLMTIFANRIMSDALFVDDRKLALHGFFLRHIAQNYIVFKNKLAAPGIPRSTAKSIKEKGEKRPTILCNLFKN